MNIYQPFTYVLTFEPTGQRYYGVRYAKNAHPSQLWTTYFTSSKVIKALIKEHGKESFNAEVRQVFTTKEDAVLWEYKVLSKLDAAHDNAWFNKINGDANFSSILNWSDEAKAKYSSRRKGIQFTDEHKANLSKAKKGTTQSAETKAKRSAALKGRKRPPRSKEWQDKITNSLRTRKNKI